MTRLNVFGLVLCVAVVLGAAGAEAADAPSYMPGVGEQLQAMRKVLQEQQQEINALKLKAGLADGDRNALEKQREMIANLIKAETGKLTSSWGWVGNWTLKGDLRYRYEWINDGTRDDDARDRNRHRLRARLGLFGKITDEFDVGLQLASGGEDPVSTNQTEDNWFTSKDVWWDLMYFDYRPKAVPGLKVTGGKMKNPFYEVNGMDLVWDGDLRPEGLAFNYECTPCRDLTLFVNGGGFYLDEEHHADGTTADTSLWGVQVYGKLDLPQVRKGAYVLAGCSYYDYANADAHPMYDNDNFGNSFANVGGDLFYVMDYNIVNPFVEVGVPVGGLPLTVFGELAVNVSAEDNPLLTDNDFAWLVGCQLGKCKEPGTWQVRYDYRQVQPDAVLGVFTDSDSFDGGTNGKGHRVSLAYQVARNVQVSATYFCDERNAYTRGADGDFYHRLQVDLNLKF